MASEVVQGCEPNEFLDRTAPSAIRVLTWDFGIQDTAEACIQVRVGQAVTFDGDLDNHPLSGNGGNTPNPITFHQNGVVTFTAPGTFGYECLSHSAMVGAIKVVAAPPPASVPALSPWAAVAVTMILLGGGFFAMRHRFSRRAPGP